MERVVIIGGGVAGCAAAVVAAKAGVEVVVLERMNRLSGLSPWCGQLRGWGAIQEAKLLGGGDVFKLWESLERHRKTDFGLPDGNITWDVRPIEELTRKLVDSAGVKVMLRARAVEVETRGNRVESILLENGTRVKGDVFLDTTGATGSIAACTKYGQGCALCMVQCFIYGERVSISEKAGVPDASGRPGYLGRKLVLSHTLAPDLRHAIEENPDGYFLAPMPEELQKMDYTHMWPHPDRPVMAKWRGGATYEVVDVGFAKTNLQLPLEYLRRVPGWENAWFYMPLSADGHVVSLRSIAPHDNTMKVEGVDNLFVGGLRAGHYSSAVPSIFSAELAAHNAARKALGREGIQLPLNTIQGCFLAEVNEGAPPREYGGEPSYPKFVEHGLDVPRITDYRRIRESIAEAGLLGVYERKLT
ncbi:MAG: FAD-dependent oxidoreductase [Chloroflexi bacterium]|nr:FAD-dependent oxidoreductase [Chloroflexota bacterium]